MGGFIAFQMLTTMSYFPILTILNMWEDLQLSSVLLNRLNDIIESKPEQLYDKHYQSVNTLHGKVEFRNMSLSYGGVDSPNILSDINFTATPGQLIAIVGKSNSGKSTLARCIAGLLQPKEGSIYYDDVNMNTLELSSLRQFIGLVFQHDHIFFGSIIQNIALGDPEPNFERVVYAATITNAHSFIQQFPGQYNTKISNSDHNLSPGQRQSLAIARIIYRDPSIFILDEAITGMDIEIGQVVLNNLERIRQRRTLFIITQALESISHADLILVMDKGRIAERGIHKDLLARKGLYYQLYNA